MSTSTYSSQRLIQLLRNVNCFAPEPLGTVDVLGAAGTIVWIGNDLGPLPATLDVAKRDLGGRRLIPGLIDKTDPGMVAAR